MQSLLDFGIIIRFLGSHIYVFLLKQAKTGFEQKKTFWNKSSLKWLNNTKEMFMMFFLDISRGGPNSISRNYLHDCKMSEFDVEVYSSIISLLKQRTRRLSIK